MPKQSSDLTCRKTKYYIWYLIELQPKKKGFGVNEQLLVVLVTPVSNPTPSDTNTSSRTWCRVCTWFCNDNNNKIHRKFIKIPVLYPINGRRSHLISIDFHIFTLTKLRFATWYKSRTKQYFDSLSLSMFGLHIIQFECMSLGSLCVDFVVPCQGPV